MMNPSSSNQRRHSEHAWRFLTVIIILPLLIENSQTIPTGNLEKPSNASKKSEFIGSPSELAWQAWLLAGPQQSGSGLDSANLQRRITPKSVFIAPALQACADGYRADTMGRCVKNVNINQEAHFDFLLQRLNAMYANNRGTGSTGALNDQNRKPQSPGPLLLNIPLLSNVNPQGTKTDYSDLEDDEEEEVEEEPDDSMVSPVVILPQRNHSTEHIEGTSHRQEGDEKKEKKDERRGEREEEELEEEEDEEREEDITVVPIRESNNDTTVDGLHQESVKGNKEEEEDDEEMFFLGNTSTPGPEEDHQDDSTKFNQQTIVPVADFIEESNSTKFTDVLDYKIPPMNMKKLNDTAKNDVQSEGVTDIPPILILLTSEKSTSIELQHDTSKTTELADEETTVIPLKLLKNDDKETSFPSTISIPDTTDNTPLQDDFSVYEDDEYGDNADEILEEESESEILKHGEAGMTIPQENVDKLLDQHRHQQTQQQETIEEEQELPQALPLKQDEPTTTNPENTTDQSIPEQSTENIVISTTNEEDFLENVSTTIPTISIDEETTTVSAFETETTETSLDTITTLDSKTEDVTAPTFGENLTTTSIPTEHPHRTTTGATYTKKNVEPDLKDELIAAPSSSETLLYDPHPSKNKDDFETQIHTIDEPKRPVILEDTNAEKSFIRNQEISKFEPVPIKFKPAQDFVKFPDHVRDQTYVRFPSEDVNSIHSQDYKERPKYDPEETESQSNTKSSNVPSHQKPSYWWIAPRWKLDRQSAVTQQQQQQQQQFTSTSIPTQRQKNRPMLLRFWTKMPLLRDPSLHSGSIRNRGSHGETIGGNQRQRKHSNSRFLSSTQSRRTSRLDKRTPIGD